MEGVKIVLTVSGMEVIGWKTEDSGKCNNDLRISKGPEYRYPIKDSPLFSPV